MRLTCRCRYCGSVHKPTDMPQCDSCWSIFKSVYYLSAWALAKMWWDSRDWVIKAKNWYRRIVLKQREDDD